MTKTERDPMSRKRTKSHRRIGFRISVGFGVVLALHILIALLGHVGLERANADLRHAETLQKSAVSIVEIDGAVTQLQRDVLLYTFTGHVGIADRVSMTQRKLIERLDIGLETDLSEEQRSTLNSMRQTLVTHRGHFDSVVHDRALRESLLGGEFESTGRSAEASLETIEEWSQTEGTLVQGRVTEAAAHLASCRSASYQYLSDPSAARIRDFSRHREAFEAAMSELAKIDGVPSGRIASGLASLREYEATFRRIVRTTRNYLHLVSVVLAGETAEFRRLASQYRETGIAEIEAARHAVIAKQERFQDVSTWVSILTIVLGVLAGWVISRTIAPPIVEMTQTLAQLARGEDAEIPARERGDEIGEMARAAEVFRERNLETERLLEESRRLADQHEIANERLAKATTDALQASRTKSDFLANMSHEIRTPMTAILGYIDLLEIREGRVADPAVADDAIRTIRANSHHLLSLINDILDVSKIEAGKLKIERIPTDPVAIVTEVLDLVDPRAAGKGIELRARWATPIPQSIEADPTRLRQILVNLCGNAVKFTEHGSVDIDVSCDPGARTMSFAVRDTGIGMSPSQLEAVGRFEAFNQADTSTTRRFGGTGLGLRISENLARALGGGLSVDSTQGQGSTFTLRVATGDLSGAEFDDPDVIDERILRSTMSPKRVRASAVDLDGVLVFLAEDGPDNQRLLRFHLQKAGAKVVVFDNGRLLVDAHAALDPQDTPDVILMDMQMPVLDGYSATRELRRQKVRTPIIALTAHAMEGDRERCLEAGCDDYSTKPIDRTKLVEIVEKWARKRESA